MDKFEQSRVINKEQRKLRKKNMERWKKELEKKRPPSEDRETSQLPKGLRVRKSATPKKEAEKEKTLPEPIEEKRPTPCRPRMSYSSPFDFWDSDESDAKKSPSPPETDDQMQDKEEENDDREPSPSGASDQVEDSDEGEEAREDSDTTHDAVKDASSEEDEGVQDLPITDEDI